MLELFHEKYYSGHPFAGAYHPRDDPWCVDHGGVHGIVLGSLKDAQAKADHTSVLFASGMIVGESIIGVLIAMVVVFAVSNGGSADPLALVGADFAPVQIS